MKPENEIICIVDDEEQVGRALERELEDFCRTRELDIMVYTDPEDCLEDLKNIAGRTAVIISDLRMPRKKGSDFLIEVHESHPDIELMLLTAYNDMEDIQKAISATLRALIMKPWNPDLLEAEIGKALEIRAMKKQNREYLGKINRQLEIAGEFQKQLLETRIPDIPNAKIQLTYIPLPEMKIGGDFYDIIKIDDDSFLVMMGDVTGQGVKPSFISAMLKVISLTISSESPGRFFSAAGIITEINTRLCQVLQNATDSLITFTCLLINTKSMTLSISNAGHLPVYLVRDSGVQEFRVEGPAMGFSGDISYKELSVDLEPGDDIAIYTDGLLQSKIARNKLNTEVIKRFFRMAKMSKDFNTTFFEQLKLVRGEDDFFDDVTFISIAV